MSDRLEARQCRKCKCVVLAGSVGGFITVLDMAALTPTQEVELFCQQIHTYEVRYQKTYAFARYRIPEKIGTPVDGMVMGVHGCGAATTPIAATAVQLQPPYPSNPITGERTDGQLNIPDGYFKPPFELSWQERQRQIRMNRQTRCDACGKRLDKDAGVRVDIPGQKLWAVHDECPSDGRRSGPIVASGSVAQAMIATGTYRVTNLPDIATYPEGEAQGAADGL